MLLCRTRPLVRRKRSRRNHLLRRRKLEVQVLRVVLQLLLQKPMFQYRPLRSLLDILCQPNRRILTLEILMASVSICRQQHFSLCHSMCRSNYSLA
ncbi:unnamed protein product, partial [Linum tenue]